MIASAAIFVDEVKSYKANSWGGTSIRARDKTSKRQDKKVEHSQ